MKTVHSEIWIPLVKNCKKMLFLIKNMQFLPQKKNCIHKKSDFHIFFHSFCRNMSPGFRRNLSLALRAKFQHDYHDKLRFFVLFWRTAINRFHTILSAITIFFDHSIADDDMSKNIDDDLIIDYRQIRCNALLLYSFYIFHLCSKSNYFDGFGKLSSSAVHNRRDD